MEIVVWTDDVGKKELELKGAAINYSIVDSFQKLIECKNASAYFILTDQYVLAQLNMLPAVPVIFHSVDKTLSDLNLPYNFSRVNAWATFLQRQTWEVAGNVENAAKVFEELNWAFKATADNRGMVSARIVAMIINEAYYALGEGVSSKEEIDIALKLGTNYPYGPFEWASKIGFEKIVSLLNILSSENNVYAIAPLLLKEVKELV